MHILKEISTINIKEFKWKNEPKNWKILPEGILEIFTPEKTDFFQDPSSNVGISSAPLFYKFIEGDFIIQVKVLVKFNSIYDGGGIMIYDNDKNWIKLCYEKTDLDTPAIVSVVTDTFSDDANGVELEMEHIYLKIIRKEDSFCLFYSKDSKSWRMVRYFKLKIPKKLKVGLEAQSPLGKGTYVKFTEFTIIERTVENLRKGV